MNIETKLQGLIDDGLFGGSEHGSEIFSRYEGTRITLPKGLLQEVFDR